MLTPKRSVAQLAFPPTVNGTLTARRVLRAAKSHEQRVGAGPVTWEFVVERVTRIEVALSAWE